MASGNPIELQLWDASLRYVGTIGSIFYLDFTLRFNNISQGVVQVGANNPYATELAQPGMRYKLLYRGELQSTGRITLRKVEGLAATSTLTCTLTDDFAILQEVIVWPVPTSAAVSQNNSEHDKYTGKAEGAVRYYLRRNAVDRLGMPLTVGSASTMGANVTLAGRAVTCFDLFEPIFAKRDMGVRLIHRSGTKISVECYTPTEYPLTLRENSNHIQSFTYEHRDPTATRAFIGGSNEGVLRVFESVADTGTEAEYGSIREAFIDARDLGDAYRQAISDRENKYDTWRDRRDSMIEAKNAYNMAHNHWKITERARENAEAAYKAAAASRAVAQRSGNASDIATAEDAVATAVAARDKAYTEFQFATSDRTREMNDYNNSITAHDTAFSAYAAAVSLESVRLGEHRVELQARGVEKIAEASPTYGFSVTLGEALNFTYGPDGVKLGDRITVQAGTVELTDVLSEVRLFWNPDTGMEVSPKTGEIADSHDKVIAFAISKAFRNIRRISAR